MNIIVKPLSPELLEDFLFFFDNMVFKENPHWSVCYCYSYHFTGTKEQWNREGNRSAVIQLIKENKMKGYLAFSDSKLVGWCNANDRNNYQRLLKYYDLIDNPADKVCSIVCFLVSPEYRRKGIAQKMLQQITGDYHLQDYDYIEAYPGKGELSSEKNYKGPMSMYKKYDFKIQSEHDDYYVMRKTLK